MYETDEQPCNKNISSISCVILIIIILIFIIIFIIIVLFGCHKGGRVDLRGMGSECNKGALFETPLTLCWEKYVLITVK